MSAAESALNTPRTYQQAVRPEQPELKSVYKAIEYNLPPGFRREYDNIHGFHWICNPRRNSNLSARIYPDVDNQTINVSVFDESPRNVNNPERGVKIKEWSTDLRMTGEWRRRLAEGAGRIQVQAKKQPKCPKCLEPLVLRQTREGGTQFFGCAKYPQCKGSLTIGNFEAERRKVEITVPPTAIGQGNAEVVKTA